MPWYPIKKELKDFAELLGDDLRADMHITNIILNKCESIASTILMEYWGEIDTLGVDKCNVLDLPSCKSLLTKEGLFSKSYIEKNKSELSDKKSKCAVVVTGHSFKKWLNSECNDDPIIRQSHQLTEILLIQSLAIAKAIKKLLVDSANRTVEKPNHIGLVFGPIQMKGSSSDRYALSISLVDGELHEVYSVSAKRLDREVFSHIINVMKYS